MDDPDFVEDFLLKIYLRLPKQLQYFLNESQSIYSFSKQTSQPLWWTYSQIWKVFVKTGCAKLTMVGVWPFFCEYMEIWLDALAVCEFPAHAILCLACGGITHYFDKPMGILDKISKFKKVRSKSYDNFHPQHEAIQSIINFLAPVAGIWVIPRLIPDTNSYILQLLKQVGIVVGGSTAFIQGFCSARRCIRKLKLVRKSFEISEQQREQLKKLLPLLPVKIKHSTFTFAMDSIPILARFLTISHHFHNLTKAQNQSVILDASVVTLGVLGFLHSGK